MSRKVQNWGVDPGPDPALPRPLAREVGPGAATERREDSRPDAVVRVARSTGGVTRVGPDPSPHRGDGLLHPLPDRPDLLPDAGGVRRSGRHHAGSGCGPGHDRAPAPDLGLQPARLRPVRGLARAPGSRATGAGRSGPASRSSVRSPAAPGEPGACLPLARCWRWGSPSAWGRWRPSGHTPGGCRHLPPDGVRHGHAELLDRDRPDPAVRAPPPRPAVLRQRPALGGSRGASSAPWCCRRSP